VNQHTLLPVFMPLAPAATLVARVANTNDRSTVGVMNEFARHLDFLRNAAFD
jgi:hypothetical protein